jgi:hypothetical protein
VVVFDGGEGSSAGALEPAGAEVKGKRGGGERFEVEAELDEGIEKGQWIWGRRGEEDYHKYPFEFG